MTTWRLNHVVINDKIKAILSCATTNFVVYCMAKVPPGRVTNLVVTQEVITMRLTCVYVQWLASTHSPGSTPGFSHYFAGNVVQDWPACLPRNSWLLTTVSKSPTQYQYKLAENTSSHAIFDLCQPCPRVAWSTQIKYGTPTRVITTTSVLLSVLTVLHLLCCLSCATIYFICAICATSTVLFVMCYVICAIYFRCSTWQIALSFADYLYYNKSKHIRADVSVVSSRCHHGQVFLIQQSSAIKIQT